MNDNIKLVVEMPKEAHNMLLTRQTLSPHIDVKGLLIRGKPLSTDVGEYFKKEDVDTLVNELTGSISDERSIASIMQDILNLPTHSFPYSSEEKTMEWIQYIDTKVNNSGKWIRKCSKCGYETNNFGYDNYCPNCGAKAVSK